MDGKLVKMVFLDLDGVLVDSTVRFARATERKRAFLAEQENPGDKAVQQKAEEVYWKAALNSHMVASDVPVTGVADTCAALAYTSYTCYYVTSRPEHMRKATQAWLHEHGFPDFRLLMKSNSFQHTQSVLWKVGMIETLMKFFQADRVLVVDDDKYVREALKIIPGVEVREKLWA